MDSESIKVLRSKISIPLSKAMQLLKKNNGDVTLSEKDFHDENIIEICKKTECEETTARKEYQICNCDVAKAVERINQKELLIASGNYPDSKIGFILWPENKAGEFYKTDKKNDAFILAEDFNIIIKEFKSAFPLQNPWNNSIEDGFDEVGHNFFDNKTCRLIVEKIKTLQANDEKEKAFLLEVIKWLNDKLAYADYVVVYGNL